MVVVNKTPIYVNRLDEYSFFYLYMWNRLANPDTAHMRHCVRLFNRLTHNYILKDESLPSIQEGLEAYMDDNKYSNKEAEKALLKSLYRQGKGEKINSCIEELKIACKYTDKNYVNYGDDR